MKVFISHAATDSKLAKKIASGLKTSGLQVWDMATEVLPGENWGTKVAEALRESDAMVVLLTQDSLRSSNISFELSYALGNESYKGRIIPVIAARPEELQSNDIPWILNKFHVIHLSEQDANDEDLRKITNALSEAA